MEKKRKRCFNTSGPNRPKDHYTLECKELVAQGIELVENERYFTIWAPRQTGKSTYLRLLATELEAAGTKITYINLENYKDVPISSFFNYLLRELEEGWGAAIKADNFVDLQVEITKLKLRESVLIIDEVEGLNPDYFGQFLHTIRSLYHSREKHCLKSVILVGVYNIVGTIQDNVGPFNIADNFDYTYFSDQETKELLEMHTAETGQRFDDTVKEKISAITANQPGLVNGFANQLVTRHPQKQSIDHDDYLQVEEWYLREAVDKNISNIINKAKQHRPFVESLLFTEEKFQFRINDPRIKFLHSHGLIRRGDDGYVAFWVPMYQKAVYDSFYPYSNGERKLFFRNVDLNRFFSQDKHLNFDLIIDNYRQYVKRRSFKYFREKDPDTGQYKSIKEAALAYSFETYIQTLVQVFEGKSYRGKSYLEPHSGMGRSDLMLNIENREYVVEFKIFRDNRRFEKGKEQLAYYCDSMNLHEGVYLVFVPNTVTLPDIKDEVKAVKGVDIRTYIVHYDEEKDF